MINNYMGLVFGYKVNDEFFEAIRDEFEGFIDDHTEFFHYVNGQTEDCTVIGVPIFIYDANEFNFCYSMEDINKKIKEVDSEVMDVYSTFIEQLRKQFVLGLPQIYMVNYNM